MNPNIKLLLITLSLSAIYFLNAHGMNVFRRQEHRILVLAAGAAGTTTSSKNSTKNRRERNDTSRDFEERCIGRCKDHRRDKMDICKERCKEEGLMIRYELKNAELMSRSHVLRL
jgi:hypothetical protein